MMVILAPPVVCTSGGNTALTVLPSVHMLASNILAKKGTRSWGVRIYVVLSKFEVA